MIPIMPVRQWQSFYDLVMRTKKPHYIYRNGLWIGFCYENKDHKKSFAWPVNDCFIGYQPSR